ncbi:MAG: DUF1540 domain-containing protein [Clostridiales bacterium]|nr:DUF1540 domain-containing protein [Clostridiales bacterium]
MFEHYGKQSIGCDVTSCKFNTRGSKCKLREIQVRPTIGCENHDQSESQCGSYMNGSSGY